MYSPILQIICKNTSQYMLSYVFASVETFCGPCFRAQRPWCQWIFSHFPWYPSILYLQEALATCPALPGDFFHTYLRINTSNPLGPMDDRCWEKPLSPQGSMNGKQEERFQVILPKNSKMMGWGRILGLAKWHIWVTWGTTSPFWNLTT